jgi:hypothetical protein
MATNTIAHHLRACEGFTSVVDTVGDRWSAPSPCSEWDARGVVEHVIGFHTSFCFVPSTSNPGVPRTTPWRGGQRP